MDDARDGLTKRIARFASGLDLDAVPEEVRHKAKLHVLDTVGCGLAGASSDLSRRLQHFLTLEHRPGPCRILGTDLRFGPAAAAFANAAAMNALDFDDGFEIDGRGMGHPGATLVAAALSAAWDRAVDGRAFLAAIIAAYEVNNRLIAAMQPSIARFRQVYGVCQHQSIGAAVAFGRLAGLDAHAMENALGLAASLAQVPSLRKYNWDERPLISLKDFNAPAAEAGVRAVLLDRAGIVGSKSVLDGASGYWRMAGSDRFDAGALVEGLGETWTLSRNSIKPFPACRWMHPCLEAFAELRDRYGLGPDAIEAVVLHTSAGMAGDFMDRAPATMVDAQFSFPYTVAALALRVPPPKWYAPSVLASSGLREMASRVEAVVDPDIDALMREARRPAGHVTVRAGGRTYESARIGHPLGGAERPMSDAAIMAKFRDNATVVLRPEDATRLASALMRLETARDVSALFEAAVACD